MSAVALRAEEDAICARLQERLLAEDSAVLRISDPRRRRLELRAVLGRYLVDEGVPSSRLGGLLQTVSDRVSGLGALEPLLRDPSITEIMVNGADRVYIERRGLIEATGLRLGSEHDVLHLIDRIVAPLGLRIDQTRPWVDARLPDGSRVHAIVPPLATTGPTITIRRVARTHPRLVDLVEGGSLTPEDASRLADAVRARRNVIVCGGTGTGKTTILRALCAEIPRDERIITIEDAAELALVRDHLVSLEARPPNCEGSGAVSIRDLVRQSLRMRPDRIIVGEVRGPEVLDMLTAMNTGHAGSMSTAHANSLEDVLVRIESMAMLGEPVALDAVRRQMRSGLDLLIEVARDADGRRRVAAIGEVETHAGALRVDRETRWRR